MGVSGDLEVDASGVGFCRMGTQGLGPRGSRRK